MALRDLRSRKSRIAPALLATIALLAAVPVRAQEIDGRALGDACTSCHGVDGQSQGAIPSIGGLDQSALLAKLKSYKANEDGPTIMNRILRGYTDAELAALATYFSSVKAK